MADLTPKKPKRNIAEWKPAFLAALRNSGNVRASCQAAGITREAAYNARDKSPKFAAEWDQAIEDACDILEAEAWTRGRASSDTLLIFLLKAHRPGRYRETSRIVNYTVTPADLERLSDEELDALARRLTPGS